MPLPPSEYDSDSSDDPSNTPYYFNPFLGTDDTSGLVTVPDIDSLVY